jgi:hypothetical protein
MFSYTAMHPTEFPISAASLAMPLCFEHAAVLISKAGEAAAQKKYLDSKTWMLLMNGT